VHPSASEVASFIYTSGTTGEPKGVVLSHANIASNVAAVEHIFPVQPSDRSLSFLPWAHSFGQTCELHFLMARGASMGICEAVDKIIENLAEVHPTILISVPRIFNKLYTAVQKQIGSKPALVQTLVKSALAATAKQREGRALGLLERIVLAVADKIVFSKVRARFGGKLRFAISGGAAISTEVAEFIDSLGITIYEGYGLSETSPIAAVNYPGHRKIGSVGQAIPGVEIVIDDAAGAGESRYGQKEGEIVVFGPNVMVGYHHRPEESAAVITNRPPPTSSGGSSRPPTRGLRTGDMGYLDTDGYLYITGRIKEQYKLENGKYVVPTPIEEELKLSPYVANVMVYGDNRPHSVALVVVNRDAVETWAQKNGLAGKTEELLEHPKMRDLFEKEIARLSKKFKGYEALGGFALIADDFTTDNGMLTPSLKLKRRKVLEVYGDLLESIYATQRAKPKADVGAAVSAA
jgi:long-chain acyl-CoA synthetase